MLQARHPCLPHPTTVCVASFALDAGSLLPVLMADSDWEKRHAALITIAQIAEGCAKVFVTQTEALTALCLQVRRRCRSHGCFCALCRE